MELALALVAAGVLGIGLGIGLVIGGPIVRWIRRGLDDRDPPA
jgi:hypothetical protein